MKKLVYVSSTDFVQVDMGVLCLLTKFYDIKYDVIIPKRNANFDGQEIADYCLKYNISYKLFHFKHRTRDLRIASDFYGILKDIKKTGPDIIYTVSHDNPIISSMCMALDKAKTIVALHDVKFHSGTSFSSFLRLARKIMVGYFDKFQVFSKNQELLFKKIAKNKTVYNIPLALSGFGEAIEKSPIAAENNNAVTRFLFFGNIAPYKGLEGLIRAFNNLGDNYNDIELVIAGRCDSWEETYQPLIKHDQQVRKSIRFISNKEIPELFTTAHYLVLPYNDATQSGPLMIAYNYNLPVIVSNLAAFREVVEEDVSGYFYDLNDPNGLERVLEAALLKNGDDYQLLLNRLKLYIEVNFSDEIISEKYVAMFEDVLKLQMQN